MLLFKIMNAKQSLSGSISPVVSPEPPECLATWAAPELEERLRFQLGSISGALTQSGENTDRGVSRCSRRCLVGRTSFHKK